MFFSNLMSFENITITFKRIRYFVKIKLIAITRSADSLLCWIKDEFWHWNNVTLSTLPQTYAAIFQRWFNFARCCLTLFQHCFNVRMPAVSSVFDGNTITGRSIPYRTYTGQTRDYSSVVWPSLMKPPTSHRAF